MRILNLHPGADTAGQSAAGRTVLEQHGDEARVFVGSHHKFGYTKSPIWDQDAVMESVRWADVIVVHVDPTVIARINPVPKGKEVLVFHHGSRFRNDPMRLWTMAEAFGVRRQIVSTVDLLLSVPAGRHAEWMPQVIDLDTIARVVPEYRGTPDDRMRVSHAPTNRAIKGTRHVQRAMRKMRRDTELVMISNETWARCLALKAGTDVFLDQLILGYGNNAVEAWALGLPVICSASEAVLARMRQEYGGELPFYPASIPELGADIARFLDPAVRAEWAERGRAHVDRFHAPDVWVERARAIYSGDRIESAA